ncbi:MAG: nucleoid-associated protein [Bacteroidia bacterium]
MSKKFDLSQAQISSIAVHKTGHRLRSEDFVASDDLIELDDQLKGALEDYFLKPFKSEYFWHFTHNTDLALNEAYTYVSNVFLSPLKRPALLEQSVNLLKHLHGQSLHPQIKSGELYVVYFTGCSLEESTVDAIGLFKSEHKDMFLRVGAQDTQVNLETEEGINLKKLDKGAIVFNTLGDEGYTLLMVDRDSEEAQYWRDDFLGIKRIEDDTFHTEGLLAVVGDFCEDVYASSPRQEQVEIINQSLQFFNENPVYDAEQYKVEVLGGMPEHQELFDKYQSRYLEEHELSGEEEFSLSKQAVRDARKRFKSLIKLDTGVELKIHPKNAQYEYIERGYDESLQMGYYKVFFRKEE